MLRWTRRSGSERARAMDRPSRLCGQWLIDTNLCMMAGRWREVRLLALAFFLFLSCSFFCLQNKPEEEQGREYMYENKETKPERNPVNKNMNQEPEREQEQEPEPDYLCAAFLPQSTLQAHTSALPGG